VSTLTLTIPAPCDWINSNQRLNTYVEAGRVKSWRKAGEIAADAAYEQGAWETFECAVRIVCTVHKTRAGRWDAGNLYPTAKAIVDGLVDAGVIPDDSNEWVTGPDMRAGEKADTACVVVTVKALTA
jgi:crossover junction endodeoxyribonuclease RusA